MSKHDPPIVRLAAQHVFEIFQGADVFIFGLGVALLAFAVALIRR